MTVKKRRTAVVPPIPQHAYIEVEVLKSFKVNIQALLVEVEEAIREGGENFEIGNTVDITLTEDIIEADHS